MEGLGPDGASTLSCEAAALQGYWKTSSRRARGAGASVEVTLTVDDLPKEGMEGGKKETESMILGAGSAPG